MAYTSLTGKAGTSLEILVGFVDEEADKFVLRAVYNDGLSSVVTIDDHSVGSLMDNWIEPVEGSGSASAISDNQISLKVILSEDGDKLISEAKWPPTLQTSITKLLAEIKQSLQIMHQNSDSFGKPAFTHIRTIGHVFHEFNEAIYADVTYVLDDTSILRQYENASKFVTRNIKETLRYIDVHTNLVIYLDGQMKAISRMLAIAIDTAMKVAQSFDSTLMEFIRGIYSFADAQLSHARAIIVDVRKAILKQMTHLVPDNADIEHVLEAVNATARHVRSAILKLAKTYRKYVGKFSSKIEFVLSEFLTDLRSDFKVIAKEFSRNFKQFKALKEMVQLYYDYQSWLEELHFSQHLEDACDDVGRYIKQTLTHFEDLRLLVSQYFSKISKFVYVQYITVSSYPPVAFIGSLVKKAGQVATHIIIDSDAFAR